MSNYDASAPPDVSTDVGAAAWRHSSDALWVVTSDDLITAVNPGAQTMLGWSPAVVAGRPLTDIVHPGDRATVSRSGIAADAGLLNSCEVRMRASDSSWRTVLLSEYPLLGARLVRGQDVTEQRALERRAAEAERELLRQCDAGSGDAREGSFELAMRHAPIGMAVLSVDGRFLEANDALSHILRYSGEELAELGVGDITHPEDLPGEPDLMTQVLSASDTFRAEKRFVRKDGTVVWVDLQVSLLRDNDGSPMHLVAQFLDVDDRRKEYESLRFEASHDPLTGLANRTLLNARLRELHLSGRHDAALLYLDIDYFKSVNDRYGHAGGDAVLTEVAQRIRSVVRAQDTVARIGGDEFIVVIDGTLTPADAVTVAGKIRSVVSTPIDLGDGSVSVTISAGIACCLADPGVPETMMRRADEALYRAKRDGRDRIVRWAA